MTDANGADHTQTPDASQAAETTQAPAVKMQILAQFVRDLSFENVLAQKGIQGNVTPEVAVHVSLDARKRQAENQHEVVLKFKVQSKNKEKDETLYLVELEYGGVFLIEGVSEAQIHPFLMIECPRQLFPFVRRILSDVTRDGGFPPVNVEMVGFLAIYRQELHRRAAEGQQPTVA
jgi:preprotein translocase subunit SecB